jgi:acylphosphatase
MNTQTITAQINALINSVEFRQHCANVAKETGITPKEWNENKGMIIHSWAIEVVCNTKSK